MYVLWYLYFILYATVVMLNFKQICLTGTSSMIWSVLCLFPDDFSGEFEYKICQNYSLCQDTLSPYSSLQSHMDLRTDQRYRHDAATAKVLPQVPTTTLQTPVWYWRMADLSTNTPSTSAQVLSSKGYIQISNHAAKSFKPVWTSYRSEPIWVIPKNSANCH